MKIIVGTEPAGAAADYEPAAASAATMDHAAEAAEPELKEQHFTIFYGDTGYSYESIIAPS